MGAYRVPRICAALENGWHAGGPPVSVRFRPNHPAVVGLVGRRPHDRYRRGAVGSDFLPRRPPRKAAATGSAVASRSFSAELALAVYKSLGRQGLEKIEGEYALAVWDGPGQRLYAQRDSFGCWPLYWSVTDGRPVVSTSLDALADLRPGGRSFNVEFLAEYLMQPMPADELPCESTVYEGINRVGPGTVVAFGASSGGSAYRYWDWDTRIAPSDAGFASLDEAGVQFASLLRHAVRERLPRGIAAAHLSGGMDSSSVACLAREELSRAGIGTPLHTLSMVYERHNLIGERAFIDEVLRQGCR